MSYIAVMGTYMYYIAVLSDIHSIATTCTCTDIIGVAAIVINRNYIAAICIDMYCIAAICTYIYCIAAICTEMSCTDTTCSDLN